MTPDLSDDYVLIGGRENRRTKIANGMGKKSRRVSMTIAWTAHIYLV